MSKVPGAAAVTSSTLPAVPTTASVAASGQSTIASLFGNGLPIGRIGLFVLAFFPFGLAGVNLMAVNAAGWGAMKAGFNFACLLVSKFMDVYFPSFWLHSYLIKWNPWFIFDILQTVSPTFEAEGYKVPFLEKQIGNIGAKGVINKTVLFFAFTALAAGGYLVLDFIPDEVLGKIKPLMQTIFLAVGGLVALAGGSIGGIMVLPQVLNAIKGNVAQTGLVAPAAVAPPTQQGGAANGLFPSLSEVAEQLNNPAKGKGGALQSGGGADDAAGAPTPQASLFLGILSVITLGGISLALARSKVQTLTTTG